jgi:hypothetical protein
MLYRPQGDVFPPLECVDQLRPGNGSVSLEFDRQKGARPHLEPSHDLSFSVSMSSLGQIVMKLSGHSHPVRHMSEFWFPKGEHLPPNILTIDDEVRGTPLLHTVLSVFAGLR